MKNPKRYAADRREVPGDRSAVDPSSGNDAVSSEPQSWWNSLPGSSANVTGATISSLTNTALPSALCPVTTRRASIPLSLGHAPRAHPTTTRAARRASVTSLDRGCFHRQNPRVRSPTTRSRPSGATALSASATSCRPSGSTTWRNPSTRRSEPRRSRICRRWATRWPGSARHEHRAAATSSPAPTTRAISRSSSRSRPSRRSPTIVAQLLRTQRVWLYEDSVLVKEPGTTETDGVPPGHGVLPPRRRPGVHHVGSARPGRCRERRGAVRPRLAPPPHALSAEPVRDERTDPGHRGRGRAGLLARVPNSSASTPNRAIITVHHARTIHGAHANDSATRRRRAISVRYAGDDVVYRIKPGAPTKPHHAALVEGQPLEPPACPQVWPAAAALDTARS